IQDDGQGRAQTYTEKVPVDTTYIKKSVSSLCQDHISERIDGLEVVERAVKGHPLVIVRVPESERIPHMVTLGERTDFWFRYHDGKRSMRIGEIKEGFAKDMVAKRLSSVESLLGRVFRTLSSEQEYEQLRKRLESGTLPLLVNVDSA